MLGVETGYGYFEKPAPIGKISMKAVSWQRAKKLAEPEAGLSGHDEVSFLNPLDGTVIASRTTDESGLVEFEVPAGAYTLLGASDEPQNVDVQAGKERSSN